MSQQLSGSCLCGSIHYLVRGQPIYITHCHCATCRKASGAAFVTWFTVRVSEVEWRGDPVAIYHSSAAVERGFCPRCGTTLTYRHESDPAEIDITVSSLTHPEMLQPEHHTWWESRVVWAEPKNLAMLPVYARSREEGVERHARERIPVPPPA
jgi:hypothetical protein